MYVSVQQWAVVSTLFILTQNAYPSFHSVSFWLFTSQSGLMYLSVIGLGLAPGLPSVSRQRWLPLFSTVWCHHRVTPWQLEQALSLKCLVRTSPLLTALHIWTGPLNLHLALNKLQLCFQKICMLIMPALCAVIAYYSLALCSCFQFYIHSSLRILFFIHWFCDKNKTVKIKPYIQTVLPQNAKRKAKICLFWQRSDL